MLDVHGNEPLSKDGIIRNHIIFYNVDSLDNIDDDAKDKFFKYTGDIPEFTNGYWQRAAIGYPVGVPDTNYDLIIENEDTRYWEL